MNEGEMVPAVMSVSVRCDDDINAGGCAVTVIVSCGCGYSGRRN